VEGATAERALARVRDRGIVVSAVSASVVALVAWPVRTVVPGVGGDWEWVAALSYAAEHGLRFGERIAWSYGPLGFLFTSYGPVRYYGGVFVASWLFALLVQLLLAGTLLATLRRVLPLALAAVASAVVLALVPDRLLALGFAWCALAVLRGEDAPRDRLAAAFPFAIGALTGIALLGKLNQGVELAVLATLTLVATARRRDALAFGATLLASAAACWLATGQALADVWPSLRNGVEVVAGYAAAMGATEPAHRWALPVALLVVALALTLAWDAGRGRARLRRRALLALCAVYAFLNFKEGFVRQDAGHVAEFFGDMLVLFAVLLAQPRRWCALVASVVAFALVAGGLLGLPELRRTLNPSANMLAAADQARTLASPTRQDAVAATLRLAIVAEYRIPPRLLGAVGRRTVMFWPYLWAEIAYADDLRLRPFPTLEPYEAYTPALDRLGATMLRSARAPERILRALAQGIDGRQAAFEAPLATLAILCRYRHVTGRPPWELLVRSRDRCGVPRTLRTVSVRWGATLRVPRPDQPDALLLARVQDAGPHGLERLRSLVLRPGRRFVSLDGAQRTPLVAATAADGILLRAPREADYPAPFQMAPNPSRIAISREGSQPSGRIRIAFAEVPIARFPPPARAGR
jgi:hypothetical protein